MKKNLFWLLLVVCGVFLLEASLQIAGLMVRQADRGSRSSFAAVDRNARRIMFIGDSWTYGSEAQNDKGYVEIFKSRIEDRLPGEKVQVFNYAYPCSNSAQCLYQFLDHYRQVKPDILVVLCGPNNSWNTADVDRVRLRVATILDNVETAGSGIVLANVTAWLGKLKTVKLARLAYYNLFESEKERKISDVSRISDTPYAWKMHELINTVSKDAARAHLVAKRAEARNYDHFFRLVLYTFGNDFQKTKDFLTEKKLFTPGLIKGDPEKDARRNNEYVLKQGFFLVEHLGYLQRICREAGIRLVIQTYPHFEYMQIYNDVIRDFCKSRGVLCVDHYQYFAQNLSPARQKQIFSNSHPLNEGHRYMGENLFNFFVDKGLFQPQEAYVLE